MQVLAVGVTGRYAGLVVPEFKKRGLRVRGLVRDRSQESLARERGADEVVQGDLRDPASLRHALQDVDGVFHIGPAFAPDEIDMGIAMVDAAQSEGVRKFVFSSVIHPSLLALTNHAAKIPVEEAVCESGMNFTILQPALFMQTLELSWDNVVQRARFALPYSVQSRVGYVDYRDVGEAAAVAFSTNRLDYGTYELCAPGMRNRIEVAALMSEALGYDVEAAEVPFDEWAASVGLREGPRREGMRRLYEHYDRHGFPGGNALVLRDILEREPRSLRDYLRELAEHDGRHALRWAS
ncbi:MAG: NmrA family NAD(P)-binding protein [Acidobacteriaceae bacterium]